jgi:hypothetical protein
VNCALSPISIIANSNEINSAGAAHVDIQRNYVSRNGLDLNGYSPNNKNITISNNVIEDNGVLNVMGHAIHFAGTNIIITKNIARNTAISAIVISGAPNSNPTPGEKFEVSDNVPKEFSFKIHPQAGSAATRFQERRNAPSKLMVTRLAMAAHEFMTSQLRTISSPKAPLWAIRVFVLQMLKISQSKTIGSRPRIGGEARCARFLHLEFR